MIDERTKAVARKIASIEAGEGLPIDKKLDIVERTWKRYLWEAEIFLEVADSFHIDISELKE